MNQLPKNRVLSNRTKRALLTPLRLLLTDRVYFLASLARAVHVLMLSIDFTRLLDASVLRVHCACRFHVSDTCIRCTFPAWWCFYHVNLTLRVFHMSLLSSGSNASLGRVRYLFGVSVTPARCACPLHACIRYKRVFYLFGFRVNCKQALFSHGRCPHLICCTRLFTRIRDTHRWHLSVYRADFCRVYTVHMSIMVNIDCARFLDVAGMYLFRVCVWHVRCTHLMLQTVRLVNIDQG